jgi:replicative DNA helicase|uniref:Exonuclease V n=1 Tax=Podoviridae sp. ctz6O13 TaxID=2827757 RepID=A0A8S5TKX2_9CAUD|nr:MAG TPA: Exonuclease V [Podoviridae sp. ctz6O13]
MTMNMNIDKRNGDICFNEQSHVYFNLKEPDRKYVSVTTLLHKFEPPFDKEFWSAYKALQKIMQPDYWKLAGKELLAKKSFDDKFLAAYEVDVKDLNAVQQAILDDWQRENHASTERGSKIHSDLEHSFYRQKTDISLQKYGVGGRFVCDEGRTELDLENGIYPEYLIHYDSPDGKIHLAGQIDLLVRDGNSFSIIDWKGLPLDTPIPTETGWTTMGDVKEGDKVFDRDGNVCTVTHKSEVHINPCFKILFTTGESIVADEDHRWVVSLLPDIARTSIVMTTKEISKYLERHPEVELVIEDCKPLQLEEKELPADYIDYDLVLRGSYQQRWDALMKIFKECITLRGDVYVIPKMDYSDQAEELLCTFGIQTHRLADGAVEFRTDLFPFLTDMRSLPGLGYRTIQSVERVDIVPTQCIEVDSPSHTYLCTRMFLVTHNTNKQIKQKSYFDKKTKTSERLRYPLNTLDNCNYSIYNMQLSTYAWMLQQQHPEWECKELVLVHFDHNNNMTTYKMEYLKDNVERVMNWWKKEAVLEMHRAKNKRIEY